MTQRVNKVVPSTNGGIGQYLDDSSIYKLASNVAKDMNNFNHDKVTERNFVLLRDMISIFDASGVISESDADKLLSHNSDIALSGLRYEEKVAIINKAYNKNYRMYEGNVIPTTSTFKNMWDVAGKVIDYLNENKMIPFTDSEFAQFKQAYNSVLVMYPDLDKIVNNDLKGLWQAYRNIRDSKTSSNRMF